MIETKPGGEAAMAKKRDLTDRLIDAALKLAVEQRWRQVTLADIARAAGASLAETYRVLPSRSAVLDAFTRRIDAEVLSADAVEEDSVRPRDRVFDVLMRRFDALQRHRAAVAAILRDSLRDPVAMAASAPQFLRSMRWMGEAAGLRMDGLGGALRTKAIAAAWASALRTWLDDESPDLSPTMAALDQRLRWAERFGAFGRETGAAEEPREEGPAEEASPG
jgi:AcrR family transcriptional regulator